MFRCLLVLSLLLQNCSSFTPLSTGTGTSTRVNRQDFLTTIVASSTAIVTSSVLLPTEPAHARGRATLEYAIDRYYPRIEAGGVFYANDLKKAIERNDWTAIKVSFFKSH
jgi:hypothetical protein